MRKRNTAAISRFGASLRRRDGFIIVAVLWILLMLATLATIYSVYVGKSALALTANDAGLETELLASAGLELTAYQLLSAEQEQRPTHGQFRVRLGRANLTVTFVSEAARIDLNEAPKPLLAGLFVVLGARGPDADRYADRIVGWRTEPKAAAQNTEVSLYRAAGLSYLPRGALFAHVNELWLVQGLPPALVERALPFVTVYSGQAAVDVLDAAPEVLAALPDMTQDRLDNILNRRETMTSAPKAAADLLGSDDPAATTQSSKAFRVNVHIKHDDGRITRSEAVILLGSDKVPYQVLSWRDVADELPALPRPAARMIPR
jgi:general secretion pathway protein K